MDTLNDKTHVLEDMVKMNNRRFHHTILFGVKFKTYRLFWQFFTEYLGP